MPFTPVCQGPITIGHANSGALMQGTRAPHFERFQG